MSISIFPFSWAIEKTQKWNILVGIFCFSIFPLLIENEKNRKLTCSPLNFLFFYVWQKMEKSQLCLFLLRFPYFGKLERLSSIVLNILFWFEMYTNDLLKYLSFNGRIRASSVEELGMRQFLAGPSKVGGDCESSDCL